MNVKSEVIIAPMPLYSKTCSFKASQDEFLYSDYTMLKKSKSKGFCTSCGIILFELNPSNVGVCNLC
jgi:hypothetical protein